METKTAAHASTTRFEGTPEQLGECTRMLKYVLAHGYEGQVAVGDTLLVSSNVAGIHLTHVSEEQKTRTPLVSVKHRDRTAMTVARQLLNSTEIPFTVIEKQRVSYVPSVICDRVSRCQSFDVMVLAQGTSKWLIARGEKSPDIWVAEIGQDHSRVVDDEHEYRPVNISFIDVLHATQFKGARQVGHNVPWQLMDAVRKLPISLAA